MARFRHPVTVGLAVDDWPELDRLCWEDATREGDLLAGSGPAAHWSPSTRRTSEKCYGRWLRFLKEAGRLGTPRRVGDRVSEVNIRAFITRRREQVSHSTVRTDVLRLSSMIAVLDPAADRSLLKQVVARLEALAKPVREKHLVSPLDLLALGEALMIGWRDREGHDQRLNAVDFRDGLMIALLALCPLRISNLAIIVIGEHLQIANGRPSLAFAAREMKGRRELAFALPEALWAYLDAYLRNIHPLLYSAGPLIGAPLWPSVQRGKPQMSAHGIYTAITVRTRAHFGRRVSPHWFRDAAATFVCELAPEHAAMAASVLQHRDLETTMRHYIHGSQHEAAHRYREAIEALIADVITDEAEGV